MSKHTAGPWRVELTRGKGNDKLFTVVSDSEEEWIVEGAVVTDKDIPNLNLIAAAPELLEAAESFLNHLNCESEDYNDSRMVYLRGLIAKAKGECK